MKHMKAIPFLILALVIFYPASGIAAAKAEFILKMSTGLADSSPNAQAMRAFKTHLEELTGGRIAVQVYTGSTLVTSDEMNAEMAVSGGVEIAVSPPFALGKVTGAPELEIFDYPFIFKTDEVMLEYVERDVIKRVVQRIEAKYDVKVMGFYHISWLDLHNRVRPLINMPEDGEGLKLRSPMGGIWVDTIKSLGPTPVPIAFGEMFSALQQGTLDGVYTTASNMWNGRFYEVIKHVTLSDQVLSAYVVMVNKNFYNRLPADLQGHLTTALDAFRTNALKLYNEERKQLPAKMREKGLQVYDFTPEDYAKWKAAVQPAIERNKAALGEGFYDETVKVLEEIEAKLGL